MSRKIVLLSDGTGNSSAKVWRTNVWRVFERLDLSGSDHIAFYDDGVGTAAFKPLAILGGAFGFGLKRNVIDIYKFACRNYREASDEIYGFGFSRGAFTMRVVIGLILHQGLVRANDETELHARAVAAYRAYRAANYHTRWPRYLRPESLARWVRGLFVRSHYDGSDNQKNVTVRFLGLWDTVAAYGMPVEEMTRGISQWLWPLMLPNCVLDKRVKRACHALSADDERTTFHPVLWDERDEAPLRPDAGGRRKLFNERISQVWFPGAHSNVGGGYPDDSVAQIPLIWIMSEARACGLKFKSNPAASPQTIDHPGTAQDKDGRIYDPRAGLGGYYRYGPRDIARLGEELLLRKDQTQALPRIHESVLKRIQNRAHAYAPTGLPAHYEVVTATGEVLTPQENPYEKPDQAVARRNAQEEIGNTIWLRRVVYFLTVGVSIFLLAFPLVQERPVSGELGSKLGWISEIVRTVGSALPAIAEPWVNGYARAPLQFAVTLVILAALILWGSALARRIQNRLDVLFQASLSSRLADKDLPTDAVYRLRTHPKYVKAIDTVKRTVAPAVFAAMFLYLGLALVNRVVFNLQDYAGWTCNELTTRDNKFYLSPDEYLVAGSTRANFSGLRDRAKAGGAASLSPFALVKEQIPVFETRNFCQSIGVRLEANKKYLVSFESTKSFKDGSIPAEREFGSLSATPFWAKPVMMLGLPFRRQMLKPWFRVTARSGAAGAYESFILPDPTDVRLINSVISFRTEGELFLYVNDVAVGIPGLYDLFYRINNQGSTKVFVWRLPDD